MRGAAGFSLMEVLIASAILAGFCLVLASVLRMGQRNLQTSQNSMTVSFELRRGITSMSREMAQTQTGWLEVPAGGPLPADGSWYPGIRFRIPEDLDGNGTVLNAAGLVEWSNPVSYTLGGLDGRQVQRTQGAQVQVLAHGVTALQFRRQAATPSVVEMNLAVQRGDSTGGYLQQASLSTRIRLRN